MNRRALLARLGGLSVGGVAGLAGCLAGGDGVGSPSGNGSPSTDDRTDPTPDDTDTDGAGRANRTPSGTPRADAPFPPDADDVDRVVWRRDAADRDSALERSAASAALPDTELSFTLRNDTDRTFMTNFYDWAVYRWERDRWHRVAPTMVKVPLMSLEPGESHTWTVRFRSDTVDRARFRSDGTSEVTVDPVGGGHYAFRADGWWREQNATPGHEHKQVRAALFELEGDPLSLVPSDAISASRREGDTVVVTAENPRTQDFDSPGDKATFVLTRTDSASGARPLITEQVYRRWPLRDALAHVAEGVETVRVETTTYISTPFGIDGDDPPIRYDGRTYEVGYETPE